MTTKDFLREMDERNNLEVDFWDFVNHINYPHNWFMPAEELHKKALDFCGGDAELLKRLEMVCCGYAMLLTFSVDKYIGGSEHIDDRDISHYIVSCGRDTYLSYLNDLKKVSRCIENFKFETHFRKVFNTDYHT